MPFAASVTAPPVALLAHQNGWDEIGLVAIPLVIVAALLVLAHRRAKRNLGAQADTDHASAEDDVHSEHPAH